MSYTKAARLGFEGNTDFLSGSISKKILISKSANDGTKTIVHQVKRGYLPTDLTCSNSSPSVTDKDFLKFIATYTVTEDHCMAGLTLA